MADSANVVENVQNEDVETSPHASISSGVIFPLLIAVGILGYTAFENRERIQQQYRSLGGSRVARGAAYWGVLIGLAGWSVYSLMEMPSYLLMIGACLSLHAVCCSVSPQTIKGSGSVVGVSPMFLLFTAVSLVLRVCVNTRHVGYLQEDETGDWAYQVVEALTCILMARACWCCLDFSGFYSVTQQTFTLAGIAAVTAAWGATQCHTDLTSTTSADQAFAASMYMELAGWLFQGVLQWRLPVEQANRSFFLSLAGSVACRVYFWDLAAEELAPRKPARMMEFFPKAMVFSHYSMLVISLLVALLPCAARVLSAAKTRPAASQASQSQGAPPSEEIAAGLSQAAPAAEPKSVPSQGASPAAPCQDGCCQELRQELPAGCTHFVPIRSVFENLVLTTQYRAVNQADQQQHTECWPDLRQPLPRGCTQFVPTSSVFADGLLTVKCYAA